MSINYRLRNIISSESSLKDIKDKPKTHNCARHLNFSTSQSRNKLVTCFATTQNGLYGQRTAENVISLPKNSGQLFIQNEFGSVNEEDRSEYVRNPKFAIANIPKSKLRWEGSTSWENVSNLKQWEPIKCLNLKLGNEWYYGVSVAETEKTN